MEATSNRHHCVPEFYLTGFTDSGAKNGWLWIYDIISRKTFRQRPGSTGYMKGLNKMLLRSRRVNVEPEFSQRDSQAAPVLQRVTTGFTPPAGNDWHIMAQFIHY